MTTNHNAVVLVKLAAVFIIVHSLHSLSAYSSHIFVGADMLNVTILALAFVLLVPVCIASILWFFPATLAGMANSESSDRPDAEAYEKNLLNVGLFLIGVYACVFGLIDLLYFESLRVAENAFAEANKMDTYGKSPETTAGRITNIAQIIIGGILIAGRRGLSRLFYKVRYG